MEQQSIFYIWQSDLPEGTNLHFIQQALERAVNNLNSEAKIGVKLYVDRDTQNVPGAPLIIDAILNKIANTAAVVADVSIIGQIPSADLDRSPRPTPNPNVMFELGYAMGKLGWERIIMVMNTAEGRPPELLPFDIDHYRVVSYLLSESDDKQTREKQAHELEQWLYQYLTGILLHRDAQLPHISLKLLKPGRDPSYKEKIAFVQRNTHHAFGLVLENLKESSPKVTGISIRAEIWWKDGNPQPNQQAPYFEVPANHGWEVTRRAILENQPAVLVFDDPQKNCLYGHPVEWQDFLLTLPSPASSGSFLIHYKLTTATPFSTSEGQLIIALPG